ncbi:MAG: LPS export ABC transporter periplasmic protein LptC [Pseudohongiellaceae bacterium]|nr:LPS export ABC transporter periplasmic protein LptC [Pseudohongiellaceae bacterium]
MSPSSDSQQSPLIRWISRRGLPLAGIAVIAAFVVLGRDNISFIDSSTPEAPAPAQITFDAYAKGVTSILYNAQGEIEYTLESTEQTHFLDNTTQLRDPFVRLYKGNDTRWNIIARSGKILEASDGDEIEQLDLSDSVELFQVDDFGNRMVMATDFLSIYPSDETMSTEHPVTLTSNGLYQTARGLRVDFSQDTMTFLSQVKGRYEPQQSQQ